MKENIKKDNCKSNMNKSKKSNTNKKKKRINFIILMLIFILLLIVINMELYINEKPNIFKYILAKINEKTIEQPLEIENKKELLEDDKKTSISNDIKVTINPIAMNDKILINKYIIETDNPKKIYTSDKYIEDIEKYIELEGLEEKEKIEKEKIEKENIKEEIKEYLIKKEITDKKAEEIINNSIKEIKNKPTKENKEKIKQEISKKLKEEKTIIGTTKINGKEIKIDRQKIEKETEEKYILYTLYNFENIEGTEIKEETEDIINFKIEIDSIAKEIGEWKFEIELNKNELNKPEIIKKVEEQYNQKINPLMKQEVEKIIGKYKGDVSVYFKDLKTNESFEINNKVMYPCSTIKSFVLASAVNEINKGNIKLTKNFETYLRRMIIISDNNAYNHCLKNIGKGNGIEGLNIVTKFAKDIGATKTICRHSLKPSNMQYFQSSRGLNESTAKDTALLFEKLYRGEIISKEIDKKMLGLLEKCDDDDELKRGLPKDIVFSHKTGCAYEYYHDVGIVYTPKRDYIISVFQNKVVNHQKMMKEISEYIYNEESKLD